MSNARRSGTSRKLNRDTKNRKTEKKIAQATRQVLAGANGATPDQGFVGQSSQLVKLASDCRFVHDSEGSAFAVVCINGNLETHRIKSQNFRNLLAHRYFAEFHRTASTQAMNDAISTLEGRARFDGELAEVSLRVGGDLETIWIDPGYSDWKRIAVGKHGWHLKADGERLFRRPKGLLEMPVPIQGGSIFELRPFLNVSDEDFVLIVGWLVCCLRPTGPYPILCLHGEQGSSKSTTCRVLRSLVDPNFAPLRSPPKSERDLMVAANNSWVFCLENVSAIPEWLSDSLCRLATGGGFSCRENYSDGEETLFDAQRPILLNGIEESGERSDLLDRSIVVKLRAIPESERMTETEYWQRFEAVKGRILGALLDAIAEASMGHREVKLDYMPRMADAAVWVTAAESALGIKPGTFNNAYRLNRSSADERAIEGSVVGSRVKLLMADRHEWSGTASDLCQAINQQFGDDERTAAVRHREWPLKPHVLSGKLRRVAPNLRRVGIDVQFDLPDRRLQISKHLPRKSVESGESVQASDAAALNTLLRRKEVGGK
jgi:hypothetical protein